MNRTLFGSSLLAAVVLGSALAASAADKPAVDPAKLPPPASRKDITYAKDIKTIFDQSCARCHGPEKPKAKLRMDSLEGVLLGAEGGKVVFPGDSAGSQLVHSIALVGDPDHHMPPPGNRAGIKPLTKDQVGLIRAWIDQGAK
jgi:mono/diheme cytochrome c family protein